MRRPSIRLPRSRRGRFALLIAALAGAVALYVVGSDLVPEIDVQALLEGFSQTLGAWTYLIVGVFALLETGAFVGLVAPGETLVVVGGAVAGQGAISVWLLLGVAWVGAFCGDTISFMIGRKLGRGFILRHGPRVRITRERFAHVESYFERHGGKTIVVGRFIGVVRALAPFIAGSSGMRYAAFCPYSILGTGLWAATFTWLGFIASRNIEVVVEATELGLLIFGLLVAAIVAGVVAFRYLRSAKHRRRAVAALEGHPLGRPALAIGRHLQPTARFVRDRLTPGELGLELTTPLATLAVGAYVFIFYRVLLIDDLGPTPGDRIAFDIVGWIETGWLTSIAEVLTELGSPIALIAVASVAAIAFGRRRHWIEVASMLAGVAILLIAVPELADAIGRPRPSGAPLGADRYSYPSAHASYSVIYAWIAITTTIRIRPGIRGATAIVLSGIALTAVIGLTRVYLGAEFLSDTSGGWALGACALTASAAIVIAVEHVHRTAAR